MNDTVTLTNTQPRLIHLPSSVRRQKDDHGIRVVPNYDGKIVPPSAPKAKGPDGKEFGPTKIDRKYWDSVKSNKSVQTWLRLGWLKVNEDGDSSELPDNLLKYNSKTAVTLVEGEQNMSLLQEWRTTESRAEVLAVIDSRIETASKKK